MKKAFFLLLLFSRSVLYAQSESPGGLPQLLPLTPEAAQFMKVGLGNINKSSGAVQVSIPLYQLTVGTVQLPIGLNYLSQGNKVEELCSRVGYGWSLSAGGAITRKVMGLPDEKAARAPIPENLHSQEQSVFEYLENGKTTNSIAGVFDTQPDEFYYSFNGHSGKFIVNDSGRPEIITHENLQITVAKAGGDISVITIVTPDGVKYVFGDDAFEKTQSDGFYKGAFFPKTSFLLRRIILTTGDNIQFGYTHIQTQSHTGFSESVSTRNSDFDYEPYPTYNCPEGHYIESHSYSFQALIHDACYLSSIQTSTGIGIWFGYEPMPDNSNDVRIASLGVVNQNGKSVCEYFFKYLDFAGVINDYPTSPITVSPGKNGRFFLTQLYQVLPKPDDTGVDKVGYDFDYYGNAANGYQPGGNVYSQDHFGFANGKNNQSLLPQPGPPDDFQTNFMWGDKSPDWTFAVQGVLKKITHPTNGAEEFFYEPNTILKSEYVPVPTTVYRSLVGIGSNSYGAVHTTLYNTFQVYKLQEVTFHLSDYMGSPCPTGMGAPCDICKAVYCTITDLTTGATIRSYILQGLYPINDVFTVEANHTYQVKTEVTGPSCFHADLRINYDAGRAEMVPVNKITGGVRVRKVSKKDPVTGNTNNTFFNYASLETPGLSSGVGHLSANYVSHSLTGTCPEGEEAAFCYHCGHNIYTSNGIYNLFNIDNSHVYYTSIVQSDDSLLLNGGIEYTYYTPVIFTRNVRKIKGLDIPFPPDKMVPDFNGLLKRTRIFDKNIEIKSIEEDIYDSVRSDRQVRSIYIRKNYATENYSQMEQNPDRFNPFDIRECDYEPTWIRLASRRRTEYSDPLHSLETVTTFTYGTQDNVLPAAVTTVNSKDETIRTEMKYPTDYTGDPVLTAMQQNYNIEPVVEERTYKVADNAEIERKKTIYKDWFNDKKVIAPWIVQQKRTGIVNAVPDDRITFLGYDLKGNITEVSKSMGLPVTYCWDYSQSIVTAEVKNAHAAEIAYTSFEADNKGGWDYSGAPVVPVWAPTGKKAFNMGGSEGLYKSGLNSSTVYIVSYWSNAGALTVEGTAATAGRQVNGWTYYEHMVTPTNGTIGVYSNTGSPLIDELRLYPRGAQMASFTYEPLVGVTSQCDANNRISYYEYDKLNRLLRIRDMDRNIVKQFEYQYRVVIDLNAQWMATGQTRCQPCPANSNYTSGVQEHEEIDINPNSRSYQVPRWVSDGISSNCAIQPDWQNTGNTRCLQDGPGGTNSGEQELEQKDMNPCSSGQTRWVYGGLNCAVCPRPAIWQATGTYRCQKDANNQNTGYKDIEYKDMETCSLTAGGTKWVTVYDPGGTCYVCNTSTCTGTNKKCINGVCETARIACKSSVRTKETGVWKYKCTFAYKWSDCTWGATTSVEFRDAACTVDTCEF